MRAVKAAQAGAGSGDHACSNGQDAGAHFLSRCKEGWVHELQHAISAGENGSGGEGATIDHVLRSMLPLLAMVVDEVCGVSRPADAIAFLGTWLLEQCEAPSQLVHEVRAWSKEAPARAWASKAPSKDARQQQSPPESAPVRPPSKEGVEVSPKTRQIASAAAPQTQLEANSESSRRWSVDPDAQGEADDEIGQLASGVGRELPKPKKEEKRRPSIQVAGEIFRPGGEDNKKGESKDVKEAPIEFPAPEEASEDSEDDNDNMENEAEYSMEAIRSGSIIDSSPSRRDFGSRLQDRKRRFTVNMSGNTVIDGPPLEERIAMLRKVQAFKNYKEEDLSRIASVATCNKYECDEIVCNFGNVSEGLHIILDGVGKVSVPQQTGKVQKGEIFGEESLRIDNGASPTQITAAGGPLTTLMVSVKAFQGLDIKKHTLARSHGEKKALKKEQNVEAISEEEAQQGLCQSTGKRIIQDYEIVQSDKEMIMSSLQNNKVLSDVLQLSDEQFGLIMESIYLVSLPKGEMLIKKGTVGEALFIVQEGLLDVHLDEEMKGEFKIRFGDSFGELALLYDTPRMASVCAVRDCSIWVLRRSDFQMVMRLNHRSRISEYTDFLSRIPCIQSVVDKEHLDMVAGVLEELSFLEGEEVCIEGEDSGLLFIIHEGECQVETDDNTKNVGKGDWVGEDQLMKAIPADCTMRVTTESATILALDMSSLTVVIKAVSEMKKKTSKKSIQRCGTGSLMHKPVSEFDDLDKGQFADEFLKRRCVTAKQRQSVAADKAVLKRKSMMANQDKLHEDVDLERMQHQGYLGEGTFGTVVLMKDDLNDKDYAVKAIWKDHIYAEKLVQTVVNERNVMMLLDTDFIVRCFKTYQDGSRIYFVLEPVVGGELFELYSSKDWFGDLKMAKFFIACVALGLQHMHLRRVIYRDLKLENCLLDWQGYCKLTDMGIAKMVIGKTYTVCGTADYFAPETLRQTGHNRAADWWACGVLLFIMGAGRSPFDAPEVTQIYKNIVKGFSKVTFPANMPTDYIDVIKCLCRKKPEERVTMQKGGVDNLKCMPFFANLSWEKLADRTLAAPFVPEPLDVTKLGAGKTFRELIIDHDTLQEWDGSEHMEIEPRL